MYKFAFLSSVFSAIILWYCLKNYPDFQKLIEIVESTSKIPISSLKDQFQAQFESKFSRTKLFTPDELKLYDGSDDSKGIYLSILGDVYNVSRKKKHYGPKGPYHVFAGTDASRSFITGEFEGGRPRDDVLDLPLNELLGLKDWANFYKREYEYEGKLIGRYYDKEGKRTRYWEEVQERLNEAEKNQKSDKEIELLFPPCNVEWDPETGTRVWCTNKSGGIERTWIGVPRKLYIIGSESYRCACVDVNELHRRDSPQYARKGQIKQYENCDPLNHACVVKE